MTAHHHRIRGPAILFCPADRPDRYQKASAAADAVILDLEDAVVPEGRPAARQQLLRNELDPSRTIVRINPAGTTDYDADVRAVAKTAYDTVMLAKTESRADVEALAPLAVVALCETPRGILAAAGIAGAHNTAAIMWGAEDLIAHIGGSSSRFLDGRYRDVARQARTTVLLAAAAAGVAAIDSVFLDIRDLDGLAEESEDAVASGFSAKACIHPAQVTVVRNAFRPGPDELAWASRLLAAAEATSAGVFGFEGRMVDAPVIAHARNVVARSGGGASP